LSRTDLIYKTGAQSEADPFEFVMSDETVDRMGEVIEAKGWSLSEFKRNPIALFGHDSRQPIGTWEKVRIEGKRLVGSLKLAAAGTSPFIDTLRSLLEQRILRAVSVGFLPVEKQKMDDKADQYWGPFRFTKTLLMECSLVSVPANPNALAIAKQLHLSPAEQAVLFAKSGTPQDRPRRRITPSPASETHSKGGRTHMRLSERITEQDNLLITLRDDVAPLATKIADGVELSDEENAEFDRISGDITHSEKQLEQLKKAERLMAGRATGGGSPATQPAPALPVVGGHVSAPAIARAGWLKERKPSDLLIRLAVCHFQAHVSRSSVEQVRAQRYGDDDQLDAVIKATVNPAMTTVAGWAAELVNSAIFDFIDNLSPESVYRQLSALGVRVTFGQHGSIKIPRRTGQPSAAVPTAPGDLRGAFVGEGAPIPVRRAGITSQTMLRHKMGVISTFTRELAMASNPSIEAMIRNLMVEDTSYAIDVALLDAQAGTAVRPAGLLNGVTPLTATTGGGIDAMKGDIGKLVGAYTGVNAASGLVLMMNPSDVFKLTWAQTAVGIFPFRDEVQGGGISIFRLITSTNVPALSLIAVRSVDFVSAVGDTPEFDVSDVATIHEDDGTYAADQTVTQPAATVEAIGTTGTPPVVAAPVRSLWQTASIGVRMLLDMTWTMQRGGMVNTITGITW
jgi:HK97 family phage prohead protease/HK97 family phage major capsid protein